VETTLGIFTPTASHSKMQVPSIGVLCIIVPGFNIYYSVSCTENQIQETDSLLVRSIKKMMTL
jgi:hypothetical protein